MNFQIKERDIKKMVKNFEYKKVGFP